MFKNILLPLLSIAPLLVLGSCQAMYFTTLEKFGIDKRDILLERVEDAREYIITTEQRLEETFASYRQTIHEEEGDLSVMHERFSGLYDKTESSADDFHDSIEKVRSVASVMFADWKVDTGKIVDAPLRRKSRANYTQAVSRYEGLIRSMRAVEALTDPLLTRLRDHVLFMKLNLHPNSLAPLRKHESEFADTIKDLTDQMAITYEVMDQFMESMTY